MIGSSNTRDRMTLDGLLKGSGYNYSGTLQTGPKTTNVIDYKIEKKLKGTPQVLSVFLYRNGLMPMPLEILVKYNDGRYEMIYIPISLMRVKKRIPITLIGR